MRFSNDILILPRWIIYKGTRYPVVFQSHPVLQTYSSSPLLLGRSCFLQSSISRCTSHRLCACASACSCFTTNFSRGFTIQPKMNPDFQHIGGWVNGNTKRDSKREITSPADPRAPEMPQQSPSSKNRSHMMDRFIEEGPKETPWSSAKMGSKPWYTSCDDCSINPSSSCVLDSYYHSTSSAYNMGAIMIYSVSVFDDGFGRWTGILRSWVIILGIGTSEHCDSSVSVYQWFLFLQVMAIDANIDYVSCCILRPGGSGTWTSTYGFPWSTWESISTWQIILELSSIIEHSLHSVQGYLRLYVNLAEASIITSKLVHSLSEMQRRSLDLLE